VRGGSGRGTLLQYIPPSPATVQVYRIIWDKSRNLFVFNVNKYIA